MNATPLTRARGWAAGVWRSAGAVERGCYLVAVLLVLSGAVHFVLLLVLGGSLTGPVSWRKPATFGEAFGLILAAVAWLAGYLRLGARLKAVLLTVFAADCVAETAGITVQAWRHVPSHFNMTTPTNRGISMMLAVGGGVLIAVLVTFAVAAFRGNPENAPSMRLALRAGFATLLVGLGSGAAMIARGVTLTNTGHQQAAYLAGGFLKPLHGVSLHGILVLPLLALVLSLMDLPEARRTRVVAVASLGYAVAIVATLVWSLLAL